MVGNNLTLGFLAILMVIVGVSGCLEVTTQYDKYSYEKFYCELPTSTEILSINNIGDVYFRINRTVQGHVVLYSSLDNALNSMVKKQWPSNGPPNVYKTYNETINGEEWLIEIHNGGIGSFPGTFAYYAYLQNGDTTYEIYLEDRTDTKPNTIDSYTQRVSYKQFMHIVTTFKPL